MDQQCLADDIKQDVISAAHKTKFYKHEYNNRIRGIEHEVFIKEELRSDLIKHEEESDNDSINDGKHAIYIKEEVPMSQRYDDKVLDGVVKLSNNRTDEEYKIKLKNQNSVVNSIKVDPFTAEKTLAFDEETEEPKSKLTVYTCGYCNLKLPAKSYYEAHMKLCGITNGKEKRHGCGSCNYRTNRLQNLKRHMLSHKGERSFKCTYCDYRAVLKSHVQVHIKYRHTKEKPYSCDSCDYKCTQYYMLNKHKMSHLPEKLYRCEVCQKGFNQMKHLKAHMFKHNNEEKPYKCTDCDYSTVNVTSLTHHKMFKHTKEKPFQCSSCEYRCVTAGNLKKHMYTHSDDKPLKCKDCTYQCIVPRHLKTHIKRHHS